MKKNKIITFILAAMMLASLAIPASAKEVEPDTTAQNETTVKFSYTAEDIGPNTTNVYKIIIPAEIELDTVDEDEDNLADVRDNGGVGFHGTGVVKASGTIGTHDNIIVSVSSDNGYELIGKTDSVPYIMSVGSTKMNDTIQNGKSQVVMFSEEDFTDGREVTMTFDDNGEEGATTLGSYEDILTFTYVYNNHFGDNYEEYENSEGDLANFTTAQ